jgi:hypothetical protein
MVSELVCCDVANSATQLVDKARKSMNHYRLISSSVWGRKLCDLRRLYLAKIRPVIGFASEAWFIPNHHGFPNDLCEVLDDLQTECLVQFSGGWSRTDRELLQKELYIEDINYFLYRSDLASRAKSVCDMLALLLPKVVSNYCVQIGKPQNDLLVQLRTTPILGLIADHCALQNHPHHKLYAEAAALCAYAEAEITITMLPMGEGPDRKVLLLNRLITKKAKVASAALMARDWNSYRERLLDGSTGLTFEVLALVEPWDPNSWGYYRKLTRAQATMLLQLRTGCIGLRPQLFKRHLVS